MAGEQNHGDIELNETLRISNENLKILHRILSMKNMDLEYEQRPENIL